MNHVPMRLTGCPYRCPGCHQPVPAGDVVWPIHIGTTDTHGCTDCSWAAENGVKLPRSVS